MTESASVAGLLIGPSFEQIFELVEPALPEAGHLACPVDQRSQGAELSAPSAIVASHEKRHISQMTVEGMSRMRALSTSGKQRMLTRLLWRAYVRELDG